MTSKQDANTISGLKFLNFKIKETRDELYQTLKRKDFKVEMQENF